jgi:hypothetical protein
MKNTHIIIVVLIALAVVGFFMLVQNTTPTEEALPQGKIDINTVCRNALAYMSFANGEDAEVFVAECIDGKHPDVIQKYIDDLGVDGATI